jgi:hypothetical protein
VAFPSRAQWAMAATTLSLVAQAKTRWSAAHATTLTPITGTTGNDTLNGTSGNDLFDGKGGNDTINGNGGSDTYVFHAGYGTLTIKHKWRHGFIRAAKSRSGAGSDRPVVHAIGEQPRDRCLWFGSNPSSQLAEIVGGSGLRIDTEISQLATAMATYQSNNPTFNPVAATAMPTDLTLQSAIAAAWHH